MKLHTILIDDDDIFLMISKKMMEISNFNNPLLTFNNGLSASDYLKHNYQDNKAFIVFLDINMPVMNGWEFLESIQGFTSAQNTFVFVTSSSTDEEDINKANQNPLVLKYLMKPLLTDTLLQLKELPKLKQFFTSS